jgi:hypothetical protein
MHKSNVHMDKMTSLNIQNCSLKIKIPGDILVKYLPV